MKGTVYGDRYELLAPLGAGGMGRVWRARDRLLERDVAVKMLEVSSGRDDRLVARFLSEARLAARLSHPNIVGLYDLGSHDGAPYIVMELIDGATLAEVLTSGPLPARRAGEIGRDIARGLSCAHDAGLVHRDVTPRNVLVTTDGRAKVADFGIARALSPDEDATTARLGTILGTAAYLAPELARGEPGGIASDLYALGVVIHESLTGEPPFKGDSAAATLALHATAAPPPTGAPPDLAAVVGRLLAKDPASRPASAAAVADDLTAFVEGRSVRTTAPLESSPLPVEPVDEAWPHASPPRAPRLRRALAALTLAIVAGAVGFVGASALAGERVPEVEGRTIGDARARLAEVGAKVRVERTYDPRPVGIVVTQSPRAGAGIEPGETVTIVVSEGPKPPIEETARPVFELFEGVFGGRDRPNDAERMVRDLVDRIGGLFGG